MPNTLTVDQVVTHLAEPDKERINGAGSTRPLLAQSTFSEARTGTTSFRSHSPASTIDCSNWLR